MANISNFLHRILVKKGFWQPASPTLFSPRQLAQAKVRREKKPKAPITLSTYIPFGKHAGKFIRDIVLDDRWIRWWSRSSKRPLSNEVTQAITHQSFLAQ